METKSIFKISEYLNKVSEDINNLKDEVLFKEAGIPHEISIKRIDEKKGYEVNRTFMKITLESSSIKGNYFIAEANDKDFIHSEFIFMWGILIDQTYFKDNKIIKPKNNSKEIFLIQKKAIELFSCSDELRNFYNESGYPEIIQDKRIESISKAHIKDVDIFKEDNISYIVMYLKAHPMRKHEPIIIPLECDSIYDLIKYKDNILKM